MLDKLTPGEVAELAKYNADLAGEIEGMDSVELALLAQRAAIDPEKYPKREALVAAIKEKASADFAQGKLELRRMTEQQNERVDAEDAKRSPLARALRALNAEFSSCVPLPVKMFEVPEEPTKADMKMIGYWVGTFQPNGDPRFAEEVAAKDGKYRVAGSPFVFEIRGKRVAAIHAANPANNFCGEGVVALE